MRILRLLTMSMPSSPPLSLTIFTLRIGTTCQVGLSTSVTPSTSTLVQFCR
jgi:hypothetical protein